MSFALLVGFAGCVVLLAYRLVASRRSSAIPVAHWSSNISDIWIRYSRWKGYENRRIFAAHQRLGPIVRLSPNEVSVNQIKEGVDLIYGGNYDKHDFYAPFQNFNERNLFSELDKKPHLERRRILTNVYSKTYLLGSPELLSLFSNKIYGDMISYIRKSDDGNQGVEVMELLASTAMDMISAWIFGLGHGTDFLLEQASRKSWLKPAKKLKSYIPAVLGRTPIIDFIDNLDFNFLSDWLIDESEEQERLAFDLCTKASQRSQLPQGQVYSTLSSHLHKASDTSSTTSPNTTNNKIASEVMDHLIAGSDTTATTTTYILYHLAQSSSLQHLVRELLPPLSDPSSPTATWLKALDRIPLLDALINETLRLHPPVPGSQPRLVPHSGATIAGHPVPGGTRISSSAYSLHRNEAVFPRPEEWDHERWLTADEWKRREMEKWLWAWGSGVRMCVGKAFAVLELKVIIAAVVARFELRVVDDEGIEQEDGYAAGPRSGRLVLGFDEIGGHCEEKVH